MNITKKDWFCHQCSLQFDSKEIYSLHSKLLHKQKNIKSSYKDGLKLDKPISREEKLGSNSQIDSNQYKNKALKCELCQYYSSHRGNLNVHIASVHEGKKPFKCEFCNHTCSQKGHLKTHIASVHERKKPFKCEKCNYCCSEKGNMRQHISSLHEGEKPFKCEIFDDQFI